MSEVESTAEVSLRDALAEAWDQAEETIEEPTSEEVTEIDGPEITSEVEDEEVTEPEQAEEEVTALVAPEHWATEAQEQFTQLAALGPDGIAMQQYVLDRIKDVDQSANEKFQAIAAERRTIEAFQQIVEPVVPHWQMQGMTPEQGIQQLIGYQVALQRDPETTLRTIAAQYGVDLGQQAEGEFIDPQLAQLNQQIETMRQQIEGRNQSEQQRELEQKGRQIEAFRAEKDETGNLRYPHFDTLHDDMVVAAHAIRAAGKEPTLEGMYTHALAMHPELTAPAVTEINQAEKAKRAKKARNASTGVQSKSTEASVTPPKSRKEEMAELWAKQETN